MVKTAITVPVALLRRANRVLRPRDAADIYVQPRSEFARLARIGAVRRVAVGYYALVPQNRAGDPRWIPDLAALALGIAQVDYGVDHVALMGVTAARHHGAIPRALAVTVVAAPKQRPRLRTDAGQIQWVRRDVAKLDLERIETELVTGWVTTVEQTILDLADRPTLGGLGASDLEVTVRALGAGADWDLVAHLALGQHKPAALGRAETLGGRTDA